MATTDGETAWELLLQHDSIGAQSALACKLMCCSKALAAAVARHSEGRLAMASVPGEQEEEEQLAAAAWIRKHSRLLASLAIPPGGGPVLREALLAAGFHHLQLRSLAGDACAAPLLELVPANQLTSLDINVSPPPTDATVTTFDPSLSAAACALLGRLTALQQLQLDMRSDLCHPGMVPLNDAAARRSAQAAAAAAATADLSGLSAMQQLQRLDFCGPLQHLAHAPPQLQQLALSDTRGRPLRETAGPQSEERLQLQHLTALTALESCHCGACPLELHRGDVLPPNLRSLSIRRCVSWQPLAALVHLEQLNLVVWEGDEDITADQLRRLSKLTSLTLRCAEGFNEPASARAWPLLPQLQQLQLVSTCLGAAACEQLAKCMGLTSLGLLYCQLPADSGTDHPSTKLLQAVACLQRLKSLHVSGEWSSAELLLGQQASVLCGVLAGLTALQLSHAGLSDEAVCSVVSNTCRLLQQLELPHNRALSDDMLPAVAQLSCLTALSLAGTGVTDEGLHHLRGLTRLRSLDLQWTAVSDAGLVWLSDMNSLTHLQL